LKAVSRPILDRFWWNFVHSLMLTCWARNTQRGGPTPFSKMAAAAKLKTVWRLYLGISTNDFAQNRYRY
jgi:hypothetical protein